jgi:hypothetical protein
MVKVFIGQKQMRTSALKLYSLGFRQLNTRSLKAEGPNQALKVTRRAACLLGDRASAHNHAVQWLCNPSAVQLNAGVRPLVGDLADTPSRCDNAGEGSCDESPS